MKIGLLSVQNYNYGSILQAFALQNVLQGMGNEIELICYKKTNYIKQAMRLLYFPLLKATFKAKWKILYCRACKKDIYNRILMTREKEFHEFARKHFNYSRVFMGRQELISGTKDYDAFVLGSDQVWNPMNLGGDFFTMTFVPEYIKKITYAASFGVVQIPDNQKERSANYLKRIDYISVRESEGVKIVKELTGRDVLQAVDPTILAGRVFWDKMKGERKIMEEYIFCYFISTNAAYRDFANRLSKKTGLKIVAIPHIDEYVRVDDGFGDIVPESVGPLEFVNLISNAKYACTDSFHGSVFSVLYEVPFCTFSRYSKDSGDSTNSRLYSFLSMIGMEKRLFQGNAIIEEAELQSLDFNKAKNVLENERRRSMKYLQDSLKG